MRALVAALLLSTGCAHTLSPHEEAAEARCEAAGGNYKCGLITCNCIYFSR